ncbi:MAG TPA: type II secretion system protein GspG [Puia sp.]|jgi:hypothetical protein|nr:type II secretion system protein GspG [Puia sp.]
MTKTGFYSSKGIRKYYYLSLLCVIPAFGIIIGLILTLYALLKFKDLKLFLLILILTGVGIFLMNVDMNNMKKDAVYGKETGTMYSVMAADLMDDIANKLEVYKIKTGKYPDSLTELKKMYPQLFINDPLSGHNGAIPKQTEFFYIRKEEKYTLFSVGIDGIPNTSDDIFLRKTLK